MIMVIAFKMGQACFVVTMQGSLFMGLCLRNHLVARWTAVTGLYAFLMELEARVQ